MNLQLTTYEQAVGLKELGFNYPVTNYFNPRISEVQNSFQNNLYDYNFGKECIGMLSVPSLALAAEYLHGVHGLHVVALQNINNGIWRYRMTSFDDYHVDVSFGTFDTRDLALSHAITAAIEVAKMREV